MKRKAKCLMLQGTSSFSGKTLLATAFCRIFKDDGYAVAPFKAMNMSLNSYVTIDGREISRAQALQAMACGIEPRALMNPILLKPKGDSSSQIMVLGRPYRDIDARTYYSDFALKEGLPVVGEALTELLNKYEVVVIEGAGSPAEPNLYSSDIANMKVAEIADSPVILVTDIDRGGAFASLLGTLEILPKRDRDRVRGYIINKFRGDERLLSKAIEYVREKAAKSCLGILPYFDDLTLPSEDSVSLETSRSRVHAGSLLEVAVIRLPRISNFTDLESLALEPMLRLRYVRSVKELANPDLIIIPGTKNTVLDFLWMKRKRLDTAVRSLCTEGTPVIGICGGYQMLGAVIDDSLGLEGGKKTVYQGLGLLDISTRFSDYSKTTSRVELVVLPDAPIIGSLSGSRVRGYEIHMGTVTRGCSEPVFKIKDREDESRLEGAFHKSLPVLGSSVHGLFDSPQVRSAVSNWLSKRKGHVIRLKTAQENWEANIQRIANEVRNRVDISSVRRVMRLR